MSEKTANRREQEVIEDLARKSGVKASDVAKILSHLGLKDALQQAGTGRMAADTAIRVAVGQIVR